MAYNITSGFLGKPMNEQTAATAPYMIRSGQMRISDIANFDLAVPDNWYLANMEIFTVQSIAGGGSQSLTTDNVLNNLLLISGNTAAQTLTLPTAAAIIAAVPGIVPNRGMFFTLINNNTSLGAITLSAGGGGVVLVGTNAASTAIAQSHQYAMVFTGTGLTPTGVSLYSINSTAVQ